MSYETILFRREGNIVTITMNRPAAMNGLNWALSRDLRQAFESCEADPEVRAVVLTGEGRAFCAGGDLSLMGKEDAAIAITSLANDLHEHVITLMRRMRQPIIAAINGAVAGAGVGVALACDLRVAVRPAMFSVAYLSVGVNPDGGTSFFLPRVVGMGKAMELYALNERFSAEEALRIGLVNRVVEPEQLSDAVQDMAQRLAAAPTVAIGMTKQLFNEAFANSLETHLRAEARSLAVCASTQDHREGVASFLQKRPPKFVGH